MLSPPSLSDRERGEKRDSRHTAHGNVPNGNHVIQGVNLTRPIRFAQFRRGDWILSYSSINNNLDQSLLVLVVFVFVELSILHSHISGTALEGGIDT